MRNSRYLGFVIAVLLGLLASLPSRAEAREQTPAERMAAVENDIPPPVVVAGEPVEKWSIEKQLKRYKVPAVSVAVINDYKIDWAKAWGFTEVGGKKQADAETLFQAASISKPVAAMGVMHLVQEGKLNLDVNVNDYLKSWKVPDNEFTRAKPVTVRELLNHSAGTTVHGFPGYDVGLERPTLVEILEGRSPANSPPIVVNMLPGSKWRYSGGGYEIMQQVVADVTGVSFAGFMRREVLEPLAMNRSSFDQPLPPSMERNAACGTLEDGTSVARRWRIYPELAAAGLWTTPSDLARFAIALMNTSRGQGNPVISAGTGAEMLNWQTIDSRGLGGLGQGLGVFRFTSSKSMGEGFSHTGDNWGFKATMVGYLSGRGIVVMTNGDNGMAVALPVIRAVEHVYGWKTYVAPSDIRQE
jgi:CubicO group peptidase (beta-lactamase class C family)